MDKSADYLISAVRYNQDGTHIDKVRCHADLGDKVGAAEEISRLTVVSRIDSESTFTTITKGPNGKYRRGADVRPVTIDGKRYIRTDPDRTKKDNLGELPRF
jgi:hypothetical protein